MTAPRRRSGTARERGASTLEFVLLTPILIVVIFAAVQWILYLFARDVAERAAQAGARTAQVEKASDPAHWRADAVGAARAAIAQLAPNLLDNPQVTPVTAPGAVGVTVSATLPNLLTSWLTPGLAVTVTGPVEQFLPATAPAAPSP